MKITKIEPKPVSPPPTFNVEMTMQELSVILRVLINTKNSDDAPATKEFMDIIENIRREMHKFGRPQEGHPLDRVFIQSAAVTGNPPYTY